MNYPVNRTDISLFKHVRNAVDVFVKDIDRKVVTIGAGENLMIRITDKATDTVLFYEGMTPVDATRGHYRFTVDATDLLDWPLGYLSYTVVIAHTDGSESLLYTDRDRTPEGVIQVFQGTLPPIKEPITVLPDDFLVDFGIRYSDPMHGAANVGNDSGVHTAAFYLTNFVGNITIQGSLDLMPPTSDPQWFTISTEDYTGESGVVPASFTGNYLWVRFKVTQDNGTLDKVIYRNF